MRHNIRLRQVSFDVATLAQFVVDTDGNLVMANARARATFGIRPQDIGRPFRDLELSYRPVELPSLIERAYGSGLAAQARAVHRHRGELDQYFDVDVVPLTENGVTLLGVSITFHDITHAHLVREQLRRSQDLETAYEELQSTNKKLETTNQALQSTLEELETINEKLQSTNEELQAVNGDLRERTEELTQGNSFYKSVLESMGTGIIVLDDQAHVLAWNHRAEDLWGLRGDEVKGKSFFGLDIGPPVDKLKASVKACLIKDGEHDVVESSAVNRRGKAITCQVKVTPLSANGAFPHGVILAMEETGSKPALS